MSRVRRLQMGVSVDNLGWMIDPALATLMKVVIGSGIVGSAIGGAIGYLSRDARLRLANSLGIGFLVGASIGALVGMFEHLIGRI